MSGWGFALSLATGAIFAVLLWFVWRIWGARALAPYRRLHYLQAYHPVPRQTDVPAPAGEE